MTHRLEIVAVLTSGHGEVEPWLECQHEGCEFVYGLEEHSTPIDAMNVWMQHNLEVEHDQPRSRHEEAGLRIVDTERETPPDGPADCA